MEGGLIRGTKIPVQELWLKMGEGAYTRVGAYSRDTTVYIIKASAYKCALFHINGKFQGVQVS